MPITAWIAIGVYVFGIWATCMYAGFVENEDLCLFSVIWPVLLSLVAIAVIMNSLEDFWCWCVKKRPALDESGRKAIIVLKTLVKVVMFPFVLIACPYTVGKRISRRLDEKKTRNKL